MKFFQTLDVKKWWFALDRYGEIGYQYNSGRKQAQNVSKSGPKFATSSAKKKVVMNSTSETENVVPTDWDASAIVPPGQEQPKKGEEILSKYSENSYTFRSRFSSKNQLM